MDARVFEHKATHDKIDGFSIELWQHARDGWEVLLVHALTINEETLAKYTAFHKSYVDKKFADGKKFALVYDIRQNTQDHFQIMSQIGNFVQCHRACMHMYARALVCTSILVVNEMTRDFINGLLTSVYTPVRPVRFSTEWLDAMEFMYQKLAEMERAEQTSPVAKEGVTTTGKGGGALVEMETR